MSNNIHPSLKFGSKNIIHNEPITRITSKNQPNHGLTLQKNINKINNRLFDLSPTVSEEKDIECKRGDFIQETQDYINLGYIGKAIKVVHKKTNKLYSIKAIRKDKIVKCGVEKNLNKQIQNMYKVDKSFFVRLLNHFEDETNLYLIFQCVKETTLLDKINLQTLNKEQIYKYFKEILLSLQFLHSKKINSISLEPESILIDNNDDVRLTDYAYSKITGFETNTRNGFKTDVNNMSVNTYVAPEMLSFSSGKIHKHRSKSSEKSDLWQLGVLLYEMIIGESLFPKQNKVIDFYKMMNIPVIKNNDILKKISEIPDDYKIFRDKIIIELLGFKPEERITLEEILSLKEVQEINYSFKEIDHNEEIINLKSENETGTPEEQLINKLKKENEKLKKELSELKEINNKLVSENQKYEKIINEEPNEENINKLVDLQSQNRKLKLSLELNEISLAEEKSKNEELARNIQELEIQIEQKNLSNETIIKSLKKQKEELEDKLFNPKNSSCTNESLQYYLNLFNDNVKQFSTLIENQVKLKNDLSKSYMKKTENFLSEKEKKFDEILKNFITKITNVISSKEGNENNKIGDTSKDKICWLQNQIDELMQYKHKYISLTEKVKNLEREKQILQEKMDTINEEKEFKEQVEKANEK